MYIYIYIYIIYLDTYILYDKLPPIYPPCYLNLSVSDWLRRRRRTGPRGAETTGWIHQENLVDGEEEEKEEEKEEEGGRGGEGG